METTQKNNKNSILPEQKPSDGTVPNSLPRETDPQMSLLDKTIHLLLEREEDLLTDIVKDCSSLLVSAKNQVDEIHELLDYESE